MSAAAACRVDDAGALHDAHVREREWVLTLAADCYQRGAGAPVDGVELVSERERARLVLGTQCVAYARLDPLGEQPPASSDDLRVDLAHALLLAPRLGIPVELTESEAHELADAAIAEAVRLIERDALRRERGEAGGDPGKSTDDDPGGYRFRFVSFSEVLQQPPIEYIVDGVLTAGALSLMVGDSGHGKSFVALDLALCIATGTRWHDDAAVKQGPVAYIAAEGFHGFGQRLRAWVTQHRREEGEDVAIAFLPAAPLLTDARDLEQLLRAVGRLPEAPRMVFVDTLSRTFIGDENTGKDMTLYLRAIDRLGRETGAHVQLLHHTPRNAERERGHTSLRAAADTSLLVTRDDSIITVSCLKEKDSPEFPERLFRLEPWGESAVVVAMTERERRRRPAVLPDTRRKALEALKACAEDGGASFSKWCETSGIPKTSFYRCVRDLVSWGSVLKRGEKYVVA